MSQSNYDRFLGTYSGKKLLEKYSLDQEGLWQILGEDPNCDFGGHHYQPDLGIVEGKLRDVIDYAVDLPNFWTWGGGGDLNLRNAPKKINPAENKRRAELKDKLDRLLAEVESIKKELGE